MTQLPARVTRLFKPAPESTLQPYWEIPPEHQFVPLATAAKRDQVCTQIRATAFKDYLADPAEFWLKYAVGLSDQELGRLELDAADFGSLVHGALEGFGREFAGQTLDDVTVIADALLRHLDRYLARTWGDHVTAAVKIQAKAARARLLAFAPVQLKLFGEGWIIDSVEQPLPPLVLNGLAISGRYDRLDRHHDGKTWRVFDYKTFSEAKNPRRLIWEKATRRLPSRPAWPNAKPMDLAARNKSAAGKTCNCPSITTLSPRRCPDVPGSPGERPRLDLGYLCLPAKAKRTGAEIWQNYAEDFQPAARAVLEAVTAQIRSGASAAFQPSERGSDYPLLPALAARPTASYLNVDQLGGQLP
jgi:hypothetical protein